MAEVDIFCSNDPPLCSGVSPPRSDQHAAGRGITQTSSQSSEATEIAQGCPVAHQVRRACHARESLEQFEAQYSEIQQLLAQNSIRHTAGRRRSDANMRVQATTAEQHELLPVARAAAEDHAATPLQDVQQHHREVHCDLAERFIQGEIDMDQATDCLLAKALTLRGLVAELVSSVSRSTQTSQAGQCAVTASTTTVEVRQTAPVSDGHSQTGHSRAHDAVELASMKALASTLSAQQIHEQQQAKHVSVFPSGNHAAHSSDSCENCSFHANAPSGDSNVVAKSGKEPLRGDTRSQIVYSPVSDDVEVDAMGDLHVSDVQDIVLPASARAMFDGGKQPGIWLAWRMPGVDSTRPCLHLMDVRAAEMLPRQNGSFAIGGQQVNVWAQVPLVLARIRSATTLGQPACLQCELWLLAGEDSTHALCQANMSVLIGLCSIPLQFCTPDRGVVVLSRGHHTLPNVLEGWDGAKIAVQLTAGEDVAQDLENILPQQSSPETKLPNMTAPDATVNSAKLDDQGGSPAQRQPQLIRHAFEVHMLSMNELPCPRPTDVGTATAAPVARYLKYSFPCDSQALYTQDVPVQPCTVFEEATFAQHKIALPDDTTILQHLRQQSPDDKDEPSLSFEVYECHDDGDEGEDQVCLLGRLPLNSLLQAMQPEVDMGKSASSPSKVGWSCVRTFIVQLSDAIPGPQLSVMDAKPYISVRVAYSESS